MNKLVDDYLKTYTLIKKEIVKKTKKDTTQEEVINDLYQMFLSMQENDESLVDIKDRINEYTQDIIDTLNPKKFPNLRKIILITSSIIVLTISYFIVKDMTKPLSLETPIVFIDNEIPNRIVWDEIKSATQYKIYIDNKEIESVTTTYYDILLRDYDTSHIVQVKAISNSNRFKESKTSQPLLYKVPPQLISELIQTGNGAMSYLVVNIAITTVDIFGEVFYQFTPQYDSNYKIKLVDDDNIDNNYSFVVYSLEGNKKQIVKSEARLSENHYRYFLKQNTTYYISANNLNWKDTMRIYIDPISMDVKETFEVSVEANSRYLIRLDGLENKNYNFNTDNEFTQLYVLDYWMDYQYNSINGMVYIPNATDTVEVYGTPVEYPTPYFLIIYNSSNQKQTTIIKDTGFIPAQLGETIDFTTSLETKVYEYTVNPDSSRYSLNYQSDDIVWINIRKNRFHTVNATTSSSSSGNTTTFYNWDNTKLYIIIKRSKEVVSGTFKLTN